MKAFLLFLSLYIISSLVAHAEDHRHRPQKNYFIRTKSYKQMVRIARKFDDRQGFGSYFIPGTDSVQGVSQRSEHVYYRCFRYVHRHQTHDRGEKKSNLFTLRLSLLFTELFTPMRFRLVKRPRITNCCRNDCDRNPWTHSW